MRLFAARGGEAEAVCRAADELRQEVSGERVAYVVNRNINYTNVCYFRCRFCAFSKGKLSENLRGPAYDLELEEIARRTREAWERGATEMCLQGGIHPDYSGQTYLDICRTVKQAAPEIHVHAFSPLEVWQGAHTLKISLGDFLAELKRAGLGSLPGTAAEILDDEVRRVICPDKITTAQWLEVMRTAHAQGLRSTATIMFGHVDHPRHWARHLLRIRELQAQTGGFTEFVPLPFVHMEAPIYLKGGARRGPTWREALLMHAVARLVLHPQITNIQTSWVKMGPRGAQACLQAGANDLGGTLMNESITRAAGAAFGQELPPAAMEELIRALGREPGQRTTVYGAVPPERTLASFQSGAAHGARQPAAAAPRTLRRTPAGALRIALVPAALQTITLTAVPGIPAIGAGDDLAAILGDALAAADLGPKRGDVLVVTHKIVSKAEGRSVALAEVRPSARARELAAATGKDPALVEVILSESRAVLRHRPGLIITEHRLGLVLANAGVDQSNVPDADGEPCVLLLPSDPDASAAGLRAALEQRFGEPLGVVVSDSVGRAWRHGVVGLAIGVAGLPALLDLRGRPDLEGRPLQVTQVGLADQIAAAAELLMGEADEGLPAVLVRGFFPAAPGAAGRRPRSANGRRICSGERGPYGHRALGRHRRRQAGARPLSDAAAGRADGGLQHRRRFRAPRARYLA